MPANYFFLLSVLAVATLLTSCGGDSTDSESNNNLPNPYSNGYRLIRETTTFTGMPFSITDYIYNQEDNTITLSKLTRGNLSSKIQTLDASGRIIGSVTPAEDNELFNGDRIWDYVYNTDGQLISRIDQSGIIEIKYRRNAEGHLISREAVLEVAFVYDADGQLLSSGNSISTEPYTYLYDTNGRLSGGESFLDDGSINLRFEILYDDNGNISKANNYNRTDTLIFSDTYEYESTTTNVVNHPRMRLLNELPDLTSTPY